MAATPGKDQRVLFAQYIFHDNINSVESVSEMGLEDSTCLGDTGVKNTPTLKNGNITLAGFFDATANKQDAALRAALGSSNGEPVTYFPAGFDTIGNRAVLQLTRAANYSNGGEVAGLVGFNYSAQSDGGNDHGVVLHAYAAETGTTAGASVDNAAASANGGVGHVHCTAFSGTSVTPKIQHSVDDSVWVDLVSFAAISGVASERVAVAAGTTVNRYLRETRTGTFTSATFCVSFARR
jgi:hypothetical protein